MVVASVNDDEEEVGCEPSACVCVRGGVGGGVSLVGGRPTLKAAAMDGAMGARRFVSISKPLLFARNLPIASAVVGRCAVVSAVSACPLVLPSLPGSKALRPPMC